MRGSQLEKYIKDFVFHRTAERVHLFLEEDISVRHVRKKGSITLAMLWANVLQHPNNFPPKQFSYKKQPDAIHGDRLLLRTDGVSFSVAMATGAFSMKGKYIYDWFTKNFKRLLDNFDPEFLEGWQFDSTPSLDVPEESHGDPTPDNPITGISSTNYYVT